MRGLLKNNFYSALESLKLFSGFLLLFAAALVLTGNAALLFGFAAAAAPGFALLSLAGLDVYKRQGLARFHQMDKKRQPPYPGRLPDR